MRQIRLLVLLFITAVCSIAPAVTVPVQSATQQGATDPKTVVVYIMRTGKKYHSAGCRYLSQSKIKTTLAEAKANGYTPCKVCHPPQ